MQTLQSKMKYMPFDFEKVAGTFSCWCVFWSLPTLFSFLGKTEFLGIGFCKSADIFVLTDYNLLQSLVFIYYQELQT